MIDCPNVAVRDALPEYVHDALDPESAANIRAHVEACDACAAELTLMRAVVFTAPAPVIDTSRIVTAIPAYRVRPRFAMFHGHRLQMVAGFLIAAVGISTLAVRRQQESPRGVMQTTMPAVATVTGTDTEGIAIVGVSELNDTQLVQLTQDLDRVEAIPLEEPEPETPAALDGVL